MAERTTLAEWLKSHTHVEFRSGMYAPEPGLKIGRTPFNYGDILCVPHGPWMYLFGVKAVDDAGDITEHVLLDVR